MGCRLRSVQLSRGQRRKPYCKPYATLRLLPLFPVVHLKHGLSGWQQQVARENTDEQLNMFKVEILEEH